MVIIIIVIINTSTTTIIIIIIAVEGIKWSCFLPANFFTRAAFDVRGAFIGDDGNGELVAGLDLGTMYISALVHIHNTLWYCINLQQEAYSTFKSHLNLY